MKDFLKKLKAFLAKLLPFINVQKVQDRMEDEVVEKLREIAAKSDNKVDDRLVEAVTTAIENGSYMTVIRKFKDKL